MAILFIEKNEYKQQLEQVIDSKYLEGKNSIGAFYYYDNSLRNDSIRIEKYLVLILTNFLGC